MKTFLSDYLAAICNFCGPFQNVFEARAHNTFYVLISST